MDHFDEIKSALADDVYSHLDREPAEALIDAVMLVSAAEGKVPDREQTELDRTLSEIERRASALASDYRQTARERAEKAAGDPEAVRAQAERILERLDDETLVEETYYLAARVAAIDIQVESEETDVLETLVDVFEIPRQRHKLLTRRLRHEV